MSPKSDTEFRLFFNKNNGFILFFFINYPNTGDCLNNHNGMWLFIVKILYFTLLLFEHAAANDFVECMCGCWLCNTQVMVMFKQKYVLSKGNILVNLTWVCGLLEYLK